MVNLVALADPRRGARDTRPGPISLIFMQVLTKILSNDRVLVQTQGLAPISHLGNPGSVTHQVNILQASEIKICGSIHSS